MVVLTRVHVSIHWRPCPWESPGLRPPHTVLQEENPKSILRICGGIEVHSCINAERSEVSLILTHQQEGFVLLISCNVAFHLGRNVADLLQQQIDYWGHTFCLTSSPESHSSPSALCHPHSNTDVSTKVAIFEHAGWSQECPSYMIA